MLLYINSTEGLYIDTVVHKSIFRIGSFYEYIIYAWSNIHYFYIPLVVICCELFRYMYVYSQIFKVEIGKFVNLRTAAIEKYLTKNLTSMTRKISSNLR